MEAPATLSSLASLAAAGRRGARRRLHVAAGLARALAFTADRGALLRLVVPAPAAPFSPEQQRVALGLVRELFDADWRNVEEGLYPAEAAHFRWRALLRTLPDILADAPRVSLRARRRVVDEVPPVAREFPPYYRRNFHFQTGGYLEAGSARRYDSQVELLFGGTADAMRRQVIAPVVRELRRAPAAHPRVLDVACGTGNLLRMLAKALPAARLYGVDLSPHYIEHARAALAGRGVSLLAENAEQLPFADGWFDAATCVFLLHELPPDVRPKVLREAARVLRPGGLLVLADSLQPGDVPQLDGRLDLFPTQFHEPFYRHYLRDDLAARLREAGFEPEPARLAFLTKILLARRR